MLQVRQVPQAHLVQLETPGCLDRWDSLELQDQLEPPDHWDSLEPPDRREIRDILECLDHRESLDCREHLVNVEQRVLWDTLE